MTDKLNWGILSTARINRRLIPPIKEASRSNLVAVASRGTEKAQAYAEEWDIPQAFGSYETLLASPEVNAVYIPLPNSLHKEWTIKAARAGKHILCEKPLALTVSEVDEMVQAAAENRVVLLEAFQYQMHPQLAALKKILAEGKIGAVKHISGRFTFVLEDESNIRMIKELGGGSLWDLGCYPISFCQAVAQSDPIEVFAWQKTTGSGTEYSISCQMKYENGIIAQIHTGFDRAFRMGATIEGHDGDIDLRSPFLPDVDENGSGLVHVAELVKTEIPTEVKDPYLCEVEAMEKAVLDGVPAPYTLEHSRGNIATITALYRSAEQGTPITIVEE